MRTEYDFTTAQKAELKRIDDEIEQLNRRIFDLCMERDMIYTRTHCHYIFEKDEPIDVYKLVAAGAIDKPLLSTNAVVKMIFEDKEEEQNE